MLDLNAPRLTRDRAATHTTRHSFAFGGVAFEMLVGEGVRWELPEEYTRVCTPVRGAIVAADVYCSIRVGLPSGPTTDAAHAVPSYFGSAGRRRFRLELTQLGANRFAAAALIEPGAQTSAELLLSLTCAVAEALGGFSLHATAVDVGELAVLYVAPKSTRRSTAAELTSDATCLAAHRVAVLPIHGVWMACALPSGRTAARAAALAPSVAHTLPVAAVLRVEQARANSGLEVAGGADAARLVREAVELGSEPALRGACAPRGLENFVDAFVDSVAVGRMYALLGERIALPVAEWRSAIDARKLERLHRA